MSSNPFKRTLNFERRPPARTIEGLTVQEVALIDHGRNHLHNADDCALCKAERRARDAETRIERLIEG